MLGKLRSKTLLSLSQEHKFDGKRNFASHILNKEIILHGFYVNFVTLGAVSPWESRQ